MRAAWPTPLTDAGAWVAPSTTKVTEPVGVPAPGASAVIVAVNVTAWPNTEEFAEDASAVAVLAWLTDWVSGAEVLALKRSAPRQLATRVELPTCTVVRV